MVKTKAPVRLNFAGGGTDIEPYINDYGSYVLSASIKLYCRASVLEVYEPNNDIEHTLFQMARKTVKIISDIQPTSGLGGSASCFVAGLKALFPQLDKLQLARMAFYLERKVMNITGGNQDQYCAAFGGINFIVNENGKVEINKLEVPRYLSNYLVLIYMGNREASGKDIIDDQLIHYNVKALHQQKQIAKSMRDCLNESDYIGFGKLLNDSWRTKKELSSLVTNKYIDDMYSKCLQLGAIGGTLMGAGNGGYMLFMENPNYDGELRQNLINNGLTYSNIEFDMDGVQLIEVE